MTAGTSPRFLVSLPTSSSGADTSSMTLKWPPSFAALRLPIEPPDSPTTRVASEMMPTRSEPMPVTTRRLEAKERELAEEARVRPEQAARELSMVCACLLGGR